MCCRLRLDMFGVWRSDVQVYLWCFECFWSQWSCSILLSRLLDDIFNLQNKLVSIFRLNLDKSDQKFSRYFRQTFQNRGSKIKTIPSKRRLPNVKEGKSRVHLCNVWKSTFGRKTMDLCHVFCFSSSKVAISKSRFWKF